MTIEIANRLQKLRKQNNFSQEELAAKIGVSRQAVSKWERAEASPDTDNLLLLAKLYNVSLDEMLRTDESIMNLNYGFRNENTEEPEKPVSVGISLKKEDYIREEKPSEQDFTDIEIYPQKPAVSSVPQGSPFGEEPIRAKNIAAEAPKSQFTTAQEFTAQTNSERINSTQNNTWQDSPYKNTGASSANSSGSDDSFAQIGNEIGKIGREIGKGLEIAGKELGKGLDMVGREIGKQMDSNANNNTSPNNNNASAPTYNYNYCYSTKKDTVNTHKDEKESYKEERRNKRSGRHNCKTDSKPSNPMYAFPYPVLATIAFFALGFMFDAWHPAWMVFLTIPLFYTTIASVEKKNPAIFCYPVLTVIIFLALGFMFSSTWSWGWLIFLTIPMYYTWAGTCKKFKEYKDK